MKSEVKVQGDQDKKGSNIYQRRKFEVSEYNVSFQDQLVQEHGKIK